MKDWFRNLFSGRQGMDEFSKALFWGGIASFALAILLAMLGLSVLSAIFRYIGTFMLVIAFVRAFSRSLMQRESENYMFLSWKAKKQRQLEAAKDRHKQRKQYKFFKCPGCHSWLRVPKGAGKIHINCKCGYTLYRKT